MTQPAPFKIRCSACHAKNRVPADKLGQRAVCGRCKAALETSAASVREPVRVSDADFETLVLQSPLPVLLYCWAPWCGTCRTVTPMVAGLARDMGGRVRVAKADIDRSPLLARRFNILSVPTFLIFDGGTLRENLAGQLPEPHGLMMKMGPYI